MSEDNMNLLFDEEAKAYERYVTLIRTASMKAREEVRFDIDDEDELDDETESADKLSPPEIDPDALKQEIKNLKCGVRRRFHVVHEFPLFVFGIRAKYSPEKSFIM